MKCADYALTSKGSCPLDTGDFDAITGQSDLVIVPSPVILNDLNVPKRSFQDGFQNQSGELLRDNNMNALLEYFGLSIDTKLMLNGNDIEGDYEFALLSDDGAKMYVVTDAPTPSQELWVDNGSTHNPRVGCSQRSLHLKVNTPISVKIDYFQGPRYEIALILLWRKLPAPAETECGVPRGSNYYFNNGVPQQGYNGLINRGWSPVPARNFYMPNGTNNCTP